MKTANLISMFSSFQGEGLFLGYKQLFVRFAKCNLTCFYCDTKESWTIKPTFSLFIPEQNIKQTLDNPISAEKLSNLLSQYINPSHHSISFTGGEPLLSADFLSALLPSLKHNGHKIFIETNATLPNELNAILDFVDIISADVKYDIYPDYRNKQLTFFKIMQKKRNYIKILISNEMDIKLFKNIVIDIQNINSEQEIILQPIFDKKADIFKYYDIATKYLKNTRFIPQMHKLIHIM